MEAARRVPGFGLFAALSICGAFPAFLYSAYSGGKAELAAFAAAQTIVFMIVFFLSSVLRERDGEEEQFPVRLGVLSTALYMLFFLFAACAMLTEFSLFLASFTHLSIRFAAFIAALIAAAVAAARRGIVNVCRCAAIFFVVTAFLDILGCILLALRTNPANYYSASVNSGDIFPAVCAAFSQLAVIPVFFMFPGQLPRKRRMPVLLYGILCSGFLAIFSLISLGVLGDYAHFVRFPFYAAAQSAGVGAFTRLDVLFLCARTIGIFTALALLFCATGRSGELLFGEKSSVKTNTAAAAVVGAAVFAAMHSDAFCRILTDRRIMAAAAVLFCAAFPVISALSVRRSQRRLRALRGASAFTAMCIIAVFLSGCENVQLQDRMIIKGVGIDKEGEMLNVTVQYIDNYSDGDKQVNRVISVIGKSVSEAIGKLKDSTGSEPFLGQNSAVVIGRKTASGDISSLLDYFVSYSESRPATRFYLSENTAMELLSFSKNGEIVPIDHLTSISPSSSQQDNLFTVMSMNNSLFSKTETPSAAVLGIIGDEVRLSSAAYISEQEAKLLDKDGYLAYCMLTGIDSESVITLGDIACEINKCKTDVSSGIKDGRLFFDVVCSPQLSATENPRQVENEVVQRVFEQYFKRLLEENTQKMINGERCDIYGFGITLPKNITDSFENKNDYGNALSSAIVSVDVKCSVVEAKALR